MGCILPYLWVFLPGGPVYPDRKKAAPQVFTCMRGVEKGNMSHPHRLCLVWKNVYIVGAFLPGRPGVPT